MGIKFLPLLSGRSACLDCICVSAAAELWGDPPPKDAREFLGRLWQIGREEAAKRQQVVQAVREAGHGKTRDELRSLFEVELDRHGVPRDPIWVERQLDEADGRPLSGRGRRHEGC